MMEICAVTSGSSTKEISSTASRILPPTATESSDANWGLFVEFDVDDDFRSSLDYEGITHSSDFGFK
jgi:hypothetical protein